MDTVVAIALQRLQYPVDGVELERSQGLARVAIYAPGSAAAPLKYAAGFPRFSLCPPFTTRGRASLLPASCRGPISRIGQGIIHPARVASLRSRIAREKEHDQDRTPRVREVPRHL